MAGDQELMQLVESFEADEELQEALKAGDSEKVKEAIKKALAILSKWREDLPDDVKKAVSVLARAAGYGDQYGYPSEPAKKEDIPKAVIRRIVVRYKELGEAISKIEAKLAKKGEEEEEIEEKKEEKTEKSDIVEFDADDILKAIAEATQEVVKEVVG